MFGKFENNTIYKGLQGKPLARFGDQRPFGLRPHSPITFYEENPQVDAKVPFLE